MRIAGLKVLVTGGLGFIGSHIVESLVRGGATVRILDNYRTGSEENISAVKGDVEVIRGDILNLDDLRHSARGMDLISHQAAQLEITRAIDNPVEDLITNTVGTLNVFSVAAECGITRILNASSAGVYGQATQVPQHEDTHPTAPNWAYGVSKLANEKYSAIMQELHGLKITNFRYAIVYGPREWYGRVLTIFLKRAQENQPLIVFGDGEQIRDFIYVSDLVAMHNLSIENGSAENQIFNVSSGTGVTINQLASQVLKITGKQSLIIHEEVPPGKQSRHFERRRLPMELRTLVQSREKAQRLLGWAPVVNVSEGLKQEWEWVTRNPHRWTTMSY